MTDTPAEAPAPDIVERLRDYRGGDVSVWKAREESADTIIRLTAEVERLRSLTVVQESLIRKAEAESEKLRAALHGLRSED